MLHLDRTAISAVSKFKISKPVLIRNKRPYRSKIKVDYYDPY